MLRTNSKKAVENIHSYIINNIDVTGYEEFQFFEEAKERNARREGLDLPMVDLWSIAKSIIQRCVYHEIIKDDTRGLTNQKYFEEWCSGLPSLLDTCYYYNRSAKSDLAEILEETEEEASKYSETQAEFLLTSLMFREIYK